MLQKSDSWHVYLNLDSDLEAQLLRHSAAPESFVVVEKQTFLLLYLAFLCLVSAPTTIKADGNFTIFDNLPLLEMHWVFDVSGKKRDNSDFHTTMHSPCLSGAGLVLSDRLNFDQSKTTVQVQGVQRQSSSTVTLKLDQSDI